MTALCHYIIYDSSYVLCAYTFAIISKSHKLIYVVAVYIIYMFILLGVLTLVLQGLTWLILMVSLGMLTFRFVATMVAEKLIEYPHSLILREN